LETGKITKWMAKGSSLGPMGESMRGTTSRIKRKGMVSLSGLMEEFIKVIGRRENKTDTVFTFYPTDRKNEESGEMVRESGSFRRALCEEKVFKRFFCFLLKIV
jgi:hypothetical protein